MSKGSNRRPCLVDRNTFEKNWNITFNGRSKGKDQSEGQSGESSIRSQQTRADESHSGSSQ